ncbi:GTP-binding protein [Methanoregula sp.]|uniref:GTP-binding protein n=1 Tax=Methanoregula sp. TaxID=2052170 RepID=UPI002C768606|nr:GTP-binding protein [Methanoregula sp.]HVP97074.1 GTP-binding protein [Methanoregula sp.]
MISTGMSGIDDMLGGGIPEGSRVLYSLDPGVDGQLFMISTLFSVLEKKQACLLIIPHTTVEAFLNDVGQLRGKTIQAQDHRMVFIDSVDRERIQRSTLTREAAGREWQARINKLCDENNVEVIFGYFDIIYEDFGLEGGLNLLSKSCCPPNSTIIIEHLNLEGETFLESPVVQKSFDLLLAIKSSFRPLPHFNYFTILYTSWSRQPRRSVPFLVRNGHIIPYIPKIVVTGPPESGKSRFVASATELGVSVDRTGPRGEPTTVAMDFGWLHWQDFDITLYGTPGQPRFDPMLPVILNNAMGVVLLVDATNKDQLSRARHLYKIITRLHVPIVVAANKKDLPGLISEDEIRKGIGMAKGIPVFLISAHQKEDVRAVLESLVDSITRYIY